MNLFLIFPVMNLFLIFLIIDLFLIFLTIDLFLMFLIIDLFLMFLTIDLFLINHHNSLTQHLPTVSEVSQFLDLFKSFKDIDLDLDVVFGNYIQHLASLVRRANERALDANISKHQLSEGYCHLRRRCKLDHGTMHFRHGTCCSSSVLYVGNVDCFVRSSTVSKFLYRLHD